MIELLRAAASERPDHYAIRTPVRELTYAQLVERAERAAGALRDRNVQRFAILEDDPATTWTLLAAASLVGAEACVYPPAASEEEIDRFRVKFAHDVLVSSRGRTDALHSNELESFDGRVRDGLPSGQRPVLILTSGTSGPAKGAEHDWGRLLRMTERVEPTPHHRWLLSYATNQFGGFQILLHVAASHATLVAGASFRPRDGLSAMRRWDVTHASGTPTFWRFLLAELVSDAGPVPALRQITLSGEAIPEPLLRQLRETFVDANISQIFGATEMGQTITVRDGRPGLPIDFLDEGGDVTFRVVDGELHVRTRSAMRAYFGEAPSDDADSVWRATGDLVEVVGDRILFRGRKTEVINVGGVKVHPLPIEERVSRIDGIALVHAYGRQNAMVGQIVAIDVVALPGADEDALRASIAQACADLAPAARPRSVKFVTSLETSGNKISRGGAK